jgi:hypothetical protein
MRMNRLRTLALRATSGSANIYTETERDTCKSTYTCLTDTTTTSSYFSGNPGSKRIEHVDQLDDIGCDFRLVRFEPTQIQKLFERNLSELIRRHQRQLPRHFGRIDFRSGELLFER